MFKWIKKLRRIVKDYDKDRNAMFLRICQAEKTMLETQKIIRDRTDIHADIHYKSDNQIIVVGRYKNRDYIKVFNVQTRDLAGLIDHLREMERFGRVRRIDCMPGMEAVFEKELQF